MIGFSPGLAHNYCRASFILSLSGRSREHAFLGGFRNQAIFLVLGSIYLFNFLVVFSYKTSLSLLPALREGPLKLCCLGLLIVGSLTALRTSHSLLVSGSEMGPEAKWAQEAFY